MFYFYPLFGEDEPILTNISKGLVQPPTRNVVCEIKNQIVFIEVLNSVHTFFGEKRGGRHSIPIYQPWLPGISTYMNG